MNTDNISPERRELDEAYREFTKWFMTGFYDGYIEAAFARYLRANRAWMLTREGQDYLRAQQRFTDANFWEEVASLIALSESPEVADRLRAVEGLWDYPTLRVLAQDAAPEVASVAKVKLAEFPDGGTS